MKENNFLKLRTVTAIVAVILFIGSIFLPIAGMDHPLVDVLFFSSYILLMMSAFLSEKIGSTAIFFLLTALVPLIELLYLSNFSFDTNKVYRDPSDPGVFTNFEQFSVGIYSGLVIFVIGSIKIFWTVKRS